MSILKQHHISFKNAWNGIFYAFTTQPNFRVHLILALLALLSGYFLKISSIEFTILILTIVIGLGAEMINTSIESMTDLITSDWKKEAKIAKDVSAGMMLLTAIGALLVWLVVLLPKLLNYFSS